MTMSRIRPDAPVSEWMASVATVLPHRYQQPAPYTLAEAFAELGAVASSAAPSDWSRNGSVQKTCKQLLIELDTHRAVLGEHLGTRVDGLFAAIRDPASQESVVDACATFNDVWHAEVAITDAFTDLCDAAKTPHATSTRLRQLSEILASQMGAEGTSHFSPLRDAADALVATAEELALRRWDTVQPPLDEEQRVRLAREMLTVSPVGHVVVWAVYSRATVWGMRTALGPVTALRPDWALPNAFGEGVQDFPERAELQAIRPHVRWLDESHTKSLETEDHIALVRVDLGTRHAAGAPEEARRLVDALLGIPVTRGGVSWRDTGTFAVLLDGDVRMSSLGRGKTVEATYEDSYGIGVTAEILHETAEQLGQSFDNAPMPDPLLEALSALREARMTDHRDVRFYGARPTAPRFATALEDHAMELIASVLSVRPDALAKALAVGYGVELFESTVLSQLMSPFYRGAMTEAHAQRQQLEDVVSRFDRGGVRVVDVAKVVAHQADIRELPMTALQRADFEDALLACTSPEREAQLLDSGHHEAELLRARHRRVRNAVNHGLPLAATTLGSVRAYAEATSQTALDFALTWFIGERTGAELLSQETRLRSDRLARIARGESWADEAPRLDEE